VRGIVEQVEAYYEVHEMEMGTLYRWCPQSLVLRCNCEANPNLTTSKTTYSGCGADHAAITEVVLDPRPEEDRVIRPWRPVRPYYAPTKGT
jgi:hypothetical protein